MRNYSKRSPKIPTAPKVDRSGETIMVRCKGGCGHIESPGFMRTEGSNIEIHKYDGRCPGCGGRLMALVYKFIGFGLDRKWI